jgi:hypothetical protein
MCVNKFFTFYRMTHNTSSRSSRKRGGGGVSTTPSTTEVKTGDTKEVLLKQLDEELLAFHQCLQTSGFSKTEMRQICEPLLSALRRAQLRRALIWAAFVLLFSAAIWTLTRIDSVALHLTAIGRILMIKVGPPLKVKCFK